MTGKTSVRLSSSVWCPYEIGDNGDIEKVQKRATKRVIELKHLQYTERLKRLNIHTLKYRIYGVI